MQNLRISLFISVGNFFNQEFQFPYHHYPSSGTRKQNYRPFLLMLFWYQVLCKSIFSGEEISAILGILTWCQNLILQCIIIRQLHYTQLFCEFLFSRFCIRLLVNFAKIKVSQKFLLLQYYKDG